MPIFRFVLIYVQMNIYIVSVYNIVYMQKSNQILVSLTL